MSRESTTISELTDAILAIKRIEIDGAMIEEFRSAMVEVRNALIHFQGELIAQSMNQPANPTATQLLEWAKRGIDLSNSFSLLRDQGLDSKTLATLFYTLANLAGFEALIDALARYNKSQGQLPK